MYINCFVVVVVVVVFAHVMDPKLLPVANYVKCYFGFQSGKEF